MQTAALFEKKRADGESLSAAELPPEEELLRADLDDMETAARLALFLMGRPLYGADGMMFLTM